jgi:hypothetical protein
MVSADFVAGRPAPVNGPGYNSCAQSPAVARRLLIQGQTPPYATSVAPKKNSPYRPARHCLDGKSGAGTE